MTDWAIGLAADN